MSRPKKRASGGRSHANSPGAERPIPEGPQGPRIAITGTPGTGKTTLARELWWRGHFVVDLKEFAENHHLLGEADRERQTRIVDEGALARAFGHTYPVGPLFAEGHLSHYLPVEKVLVLRVHPRVVGERLGERGYGEGKARENVEAEALDVIAGEVLSRFSPEDAVEVDATRLKVGTLADAAETLLRGEKHRSLKPVGSVAWPLSAIA